MQTSAALVVVREFGCATHVFLTPIQTRRNLRIHLLLLGAMVGHRATLEVYRPTGRIYPHRTGLSHTIQVEQMTPLDVTGVLQWFVLSSLVNLLAYDLNTNHLTQLPSGSRAPSGSHSYQSTHNRILSGTPPSHYPYAIPSSSSYRRTHMHRPGLEVGQASSSSAAAAHRRPLPPDPPQLAEEDECPVCHRELPPRELPNYESLREAHINICITSHSTYGGTPSAEGSSRPRRTGMFPYLATEKDCVDSAECTICLEEFEVGVPMARLECLCRFHRDCISRWFAKNPGRCPVHSHDGHGF